MFGNASNGTDAEEIIARYAEAGGNFVDADGGEASERCVGRAIEGQRSRWVVATRPGTPPRTNSISGGRSVQWLRHAVDASLDRLGAGMIDVLYLHPDDDAAALEEIIETLGELIEAGKIGGWGFSNFRAWKIAELVRMADCLDVPRPICAQPYYHALYRLVETDYLPACAHFGIGVVPYAPLARGVLAGGDGESPPPAAIPGQAWAPDRETEFRPAALDAVRAIARHLQPSGRPLSGFALQWVLANRLVSSVLIRPSSVEQLEAYLRAAATRYTPDDEAFLNELVPSGHVVGGAFGDARSAREGRVVG